MSPPVKQKRLEIVLSTIHESPEILHRISACSHILTSENNNPAQQRRNADEADILKKTYTLCASSFTGCGFKVDQRALTYAVNQAEFSLKSDKRAVGQNKSPNLRMPTYKELPGSSIQNKAIVIRAHVHGDLSPQYLHPPKSSETQRATPSTTDQTLCKTIKLRAHVHGDHLSPSTYTRQIWV